MRNADDLIQQARHLTSLDAAGRPKQANLRRAVSAAYYALFHFLIDEACRSLLGTTLELQPMRRLMAGAFNHADMKWVSQRFAQPVLDQRFQPAVEDPAVNRDTQKVAGAFVELQEKRHAADYNLNEPFVRIDCDKAIEQAADAMARWEHARNDPTSRLYLWALLAGKRVRS